jgi:cytochrome c oxidase subunit 2
VPRPRGGGSVSSQRHLLVAGAAWLVLSVASMLVVAGVQILPQVASHEAEIEDRAFVLLTVVSMPVLWFVVVGLAYSAIRFRARRGDASDGPPVHGHTGIQAGWLVVTFAMVIGLFVYGAIGLVEIRGAQAADFEVHVRAEQWKWHYKYPGGKVSNDLHLPVGRRVHLVIESDDVIHSLWLPALGVKQDAVPGRVTQAYTTPTVAGTYGGRCAELCGFGHTGMTTTFVVEDQASLDTWLAQEEPRPSGGS